MASPPPVFQPMARSPSKSKSSINMAHPIPDLQSLQGAYVGNIERLEEHAERMSEAGSDLNDEIRKLHTELKRTESRRSSILSSTIPEEPLRRMSTRSRNVSTSSHANSIVDINGTARWGGYSPAGYVTSPGGSLRSGSISNPVPSMQRQRSGSKASRLGQVVQPEEVVDDDTLLAVYPGSPHSLKSAPPLHHSTSPPPANPRKVSSFTRKYDEIANELREELRNSVNFDQPSRHKNDDQRQEYQYEYAAHHHEYPDRPPTAASTDTTRQARTLWQDFDGTHCRDTVIEEEPTPPQSRNGHSRQSSYSGMLQQEYEMPQQRAPPPDDSMVYYPAPVPRMLNLPKRLSQLPSTSQQARRRTQLLDYMQTENRKSAPLLGDMVDNATRAPNNNRKSMAGLPPQLRASAYFDQPGPAQEYAVKGESAEDTLDSILNASARAPVSAFTDHPFAGNAGQDIYAPEHKRRSSKLPDIPPTLAETKRRSSFNLLDTKRNSSGDALNKLRKRNSSADMNLLILKASESRISLGDELDEHDEHARGPQTGNNETLSQLSYDDQEGKNPDDVYDEEHVDDEPEEEDFQQPFGKPTTLLAELQLRKAQQKTRNMNYATLVEQGNMPTHRTLLEMDSIAEKEKQKRLKKKVHLAWEAQPDSDDSEDDNVPLGLLAQQRTKQQDWDRPVGLIAQREREDHEPLSRRAARLRGDDPTKPRNPLGVSPSQARLMVPTVTTPGPESEEEHEGETLGERMRRLREQKERDAALGEDVRKSTISADFATEMFSKLGVSDDTKDKDGLLPTSTPSPGLDGEETLGQRRARLQAEAVAQGATPIRPGLGQSLSMADVLSANPMDMHNQARKISDSQLVSHLPQGSLLHQNHIDQERKKSERQLQNMRASSYGINSTASPFIRSEEKNDDDTPLALKIQAYKNQMSGMGMQTPGYPNMGGMQGNMSSANLSEQARQSYMPGMMSQQMMPNPQMMGMMNQMQSMQFQYPQTMGNQGMMGMQMPMGSPMGMPMGMQGMQMPMNGMGMPMMNMNMNGGMGMPMGMMMPPMDPRQRDQIDRWMQGIQH